MFAILFALFSSFWFAVSMIFINPGTLAVDYLKDCSQPRVNALCLCIYLTLSSDRIDLWAPANLVFVIIGIFVPGVARFLFSRGGATWRTCFRVPDQQHTFVCHRACGLLSRRAPDGYQPAGRLSIVAGIVSLSWRGTAKTWRTGDLLFPLTAAFLCRTGQPGPSWHSSDWFANHRGGDCVCGVVGDHGVVLWGFRREQTVGRPRPARFSSLWRLGIHEFPFIRFHLHRSSMERVSLISPLVNASSLFVLPLSLIFLKDVEKLTARKIGATGLVILGVLLISWEKL